MKKRGCKRKANLTPRTQDEILTRIEYRKDQDCFGFETSDYVDYLKYDPACASGFLKGETTEAQWLRATCELKPPIDKIKDYMSFAFSKAHDERGLSAMRSISHMIAWAWLSGDDELLAIINETRYSPYGLPMLRAICDYLDIDYGQWDD